MKYQVKYKVYQKSILKSVLEKPSTASCSSRLRWCMGILQSRFHNPHLAAFCKHLSPVVILSVVHSTILVSFWCLSRNGIKQQKKKKKKKKKKQKRKNRKKREKLVLKESLSSEDQRWLYGVMSENIKLLFWYMKYIY